MQMTGSLFGGQGEEEGGLTGFSTSRPPVGTLPWRDPVCASSGPGEVASPPHSGGEKWE